MGLSHILDGKITVNGRQIYCKVTGEKGYRPQGRYKDDDCINLEINLNKAQILQTLFLEDELKKLGIREVKINGSYYTARISIEKASEWLKEYNQRDVKADSTREQQTVETSKIEPDQSL